MSEETKTPPPTKLLWYFSTSDQTQFIRDHLANVPSLINRLGYDFQYSMPSVEVEERKQDRKTVKYINWRGKERERLEPSDPDFLSHRHYLVFNRELTEPELAFWRAIKVGYLARDFSPNGRWQNRK